MACISKQILNDEKDLKRVLRWAKHFDDWENQIRENYENADDIINLINSKGENITLADLSIKKAPVIEKQIPTTNQFAKKDTFLDINYDGDSYLLKKMFRDFKRKMLEVSIFNINENRIVNANAKKLNSPFSNTLNENIYAYKTSLVNQIWKLVSPGKNTIFTAPSEFVAIMNEAIAAFDGYKGDKTSQIFLNARDAYTILKNFDALLADKASYIKVNPKYKNINEAYDKYEYKGANVDMFKTWTTKEDVDIEGQMSDLTVAIIESFHKYNRNNMPILDSTLTIPEFNMVMNSFKEWVNKNMTIADLGLTGPKAEETFNQKKANVLRINVNSKISAENADSALKEVFNAFVNVAKMGNMRNVNIEVMLGINALLNSKLQPEIKNCFFNLMFKTDKNRGVIVSTKSSDNTISLKQIEDNYKNSAVYSIHDSITAAINKFKFNNKKAWDALIAKYNINFDGDTVTSKFGTIVFDPLKNNFDFKGEINNKYAIQIIKDVLDINIPLNYESILQQLSDGRPTFNQLLKTFAGCIGIVLLASNTDTKDGTKSLSSLTDNAYWNNRSDDPLRSQFKASKLSVPVQNVANFLGLAWGLNISNTQRNSFGNNVASYNLTSLINQMPRMVTAMKTKSPENIFSDHPIYKQFATHIGAPRVRLDVNINGKKKAGRDLTVSELAQCSIIYEFFKSYTKFKTNEEEYIYLQNSCFSDKNTHWLIPYHKNLKIGGQTLQTIFGNILSTNSPIHNAGVSTMMNAIFDARKSEYSKILNRLISDFTAISDAIKSNEFVESVKEDSEKTKLATVIENLDKLTDVKDTNLINKFNAVKTIIDTISESSFKDGVRKAFSNKGLDFIEEMHYSKKGFNETLEHDINMYVFDDTRKSFKNRMKEQSDEFIKNLEENDFRFDDSVDKVTYSQLRNLIGEKWFDSITGEMKLKIDNEMNPLLSTYFLSDVFLSNGYNDLIFGKTFFHPNKYKPSAEEIAYKEKNKVWPESYFRYSEASRLSSSFKRTVIAGATTHTFYPDLFGISSDILYAVIDDYQADVFNMLGKTSSVDAMDGAGWASPIQSMLENMSLLDAKAGYDKKTIFGDIDPKTGCPKLLKWAVYALTNERRRNSRASVISADNIFYKMHLAKFDKFVDLSKYYKPGAKFGYNIAGRNVSEQEFIYREDPVTGKLYRIDKLILIPNPSGVKTSCYQVFETEVDKNGEPKSGSTSQVYRDPIRIDNIYAIDSIFGGAWAKQLDKNSNTLVWSDVNNRICTNAVCAEDLKSYMCAYLVNKSAIKVGACNINTRDTWKNNEALTTTKMSLIFGGVQMDADHILSDDTDVTEMSQMISSLIQSGYYTDEAINIYKEIGNVVEQSLREKNMLVGEGDFTNIHQILGKEFLKSFANNTRDTMGMAQAFLTKASIELSKNPNATIQIPFSDPTTIKVFNATIISNLNKKGIRRKYAGIASVQVPSRGMIQFFNYNGKTMTYPTLCRKIRENSLFSNFTIDQLTSRDVVYKNGKLLSVFNGTEFENPFIKLVQPYQLDMGDTVYLVNNKGEVEQICLDSWENYDKAKHASQDKLIFKHELAPHDLRGSDTTFDVEGKTYSIYDLDSVRATHYIAKFKKLTTEQLNLITSVTGLTLNAENKDEALNIAKAAVNRDLKLIDEGVYIGYNSIFDEPGIAYEKVIDLVNNNSLDDLQKLFKDVYFSRNIIEEKTSLEEFAKAYELDSIQLKGLSANYNAFKDRFTIRNVKTRAAEIIMGKVNKDQLNLNDDEDIADVTDAQFFVDKIKNSEQLVDSNIDKNSYDAILKGANGENLYVRINQLHMETDPLTGKKIQTPLQQNWIKDAASFEEVDGDVYHNNKYVCSSNGKVFYSAPGVGSTNYMVTINDWSELEEFLDSDQYNRVTYNFTRGNVVDYLISHKLVNDEFKFIKDLDFHTFTGTKQTKLNSRQLEYSVTSSIKAGTSIIDIDLNELLKSLNTEEVYKKEIEIERLAINQYVAFQKQLEFVGARIPTQSMQSFSRMKVVGYTNSRYNEVYMPAEITWLQGSDYDIDKLYLMGFELSSKGSLINFSKLTYQCQSIENINQVMSLPKPNGVEYYVTGTNSIAYQVPKNVVDDVINFRDLSKLKDCMLRSNGPLSFTSDVSKQEAKTFVSILNTHSKSKLSNRNAEIALRNSVVHQILTLLQHARLLPFAHQSVDDSMAVFKEIAKNSFLSASELLMTSDNPLVKFIMQMQNMVGKDVIGITAVGMKVFFATSTAANQMVNQIVTALRLGDYKKASELWSQLTFVHPTTNKTCMLANVNMEPITSLKTDKFDPATYLTNLDDVIKQTKTVDAASLISGLLSAATDNAKELILSKINATVDFADAWSYLISIGTDPKTIESIMMSEAMQLVQKYSKSNVFDNVNTSINKKSAIEFILGLCTLGGVSNRDLKILVGTYADEAAPSNDCFIDKLLYETNDDGTLKLDISGNVIPRVKPLINKNEVFDKETGLNVRDSIFRKNLINLIIDIGFGNAEVRRFDSSKLDTTLSIEQELFKHVNYLISKSSNKSRNEYNDEYDESYDGGDLDPTEQEIMDLDSGMYSDYDMLNEYEDDLEGLTSGQDSHDFGEDDKFKLSYQTLITIAKFLKHYLIPKNTALQSVKDENSVDNLYNFYESILPGVEEQTILGAMLGVNQGLKTNLTDFVKLINRINNFVNSKWQVFDPETSETFSIIKFLSNPEYQSTWIKNYETIKTSNNILRTVISTPNFSEMFKQIALGYNLLEHSVQNRLTIKLANALLEYNREGSSLTQKLTDDEFEKVDRYVRDLILENWLLQQNIEFNMPLGEEFYKKDEYSNFEITKCGEGDIAEKTNVIKLNTFEGQASFVHYFENSLIDILKKRYKDNDTFKAFFNNITIAPKLNKTHNQTTNHLKLTINSMIADKNVELSIIYSDILKAFTKLSNEQIPELNGMTFGDALFLYNVLVYKNGYTQQGFTRLLEGIINTSVDNLATSYSNFIKYADAEGIEHKRDSTNLIFDEDGQFEWGDFKGNIFDLLRKLAFDPKSARKFNIQLTKGEDGAISELIFADSFGNPISGKPSSIAIGVTNANDWTSEMPCLSTHFNGAYKANYAGDYNASQCFRWNSETIVREIINVMANKLGLNVGKNEDSDIVIFDDRELPSYAKYQEDPDAYSIKYRSFNDWVRIRNSSAFLDNGKIYINVHRASVDTTVHELMHLYCAGLKFSKNETLRNLYYNSLDSVVDLYKTKMGKEYRKMREKYSEDVGSDFKEELLVAFMSNQFTTKFKNNFGTQRWIEDVRFEIINIINDIFNSDVSSNTDLAKLGNTNLSDFMQHFHSRLFNTDKNSLLSDMRLDQEMKTIKRILIKNAEDPTKKSKIEYNC